VWDCDGKGKVMRGLHFCEDTSLNSLNACWLRGVSITNPTNTTANHSIQIVPALSFASKCCCGILWRGNVQDEISPLRHFTPASDCRRTYILSQLMSHYVLLLFGLERNGKNCGEFLTATQSSLIVATVVCIVYEGFGVQ